MTLLIFFDTPFPPPYSSLSLLFICNLSAYIFMVKVPLLKKYNIIEYFIWSTYLLLYGRSVGIQQWVYIQAEILIHICSTETFAKFAGKHLSPRPFLTKLNVGNIVQKKCHMVVFFTIIFQIVQNKLFKRTFPRNH